MVVSETATLLSLIEQPCCLCDSNDAVLVAATLLSLRQQRCCLKYSTVVVSETATLLSRRQQRCCLRDSNVAVSVTATLLWQRQQSCCLRGSNVAGRPDDCTDVAYLHGSRNPCAGRARCATKRSAGGVRSLGRSTPLGNLFVLPGFRDP